MKTKLMIAVLMGLLLAPFIAFAAPPGDWWGQVLINGTSVPDGTPINAYINGQLVANTTVGAKLGSGYYELFIEASDGQTIIFKIGSVYAANATFSDGAHPQLNLSLAQAACGDTRCNGGESCSTCSNDCGVCPSSGGGGTPPPVVVRSGGGGGFICTPNWECTTWTECSPAGTQTRNCTDKNNCGKTTGKPIESQACTYVPPKTPEELPGENLTTEENLAGNESTTTPILPTGFWNRITGGAIALFGGNANPIVGIIVMLLIAGLGVWLFFFFKRRRKKKKK